MVLQTSPQSGKEPQERPVLVLGLGNILMRDEGVGVRVVEAMEHLDLPRDVELFDGGTTGLDLLDVLADRSKVVVIDAIDDDSEPGTVLRLEGEHLAPASGWSVSLHEVGLQEALAAAKQLGIAPQEVVVIGVRPKDVSCGLSLSPGIAALVPEIIEQVLSELPAPRSSLPTKSGRPIAAIASQRSGASCSTMAKSEQEKEDSR